MISVAPHILLMIAATTPVHASSGSGGAVLGAAIFQIVGIVAVFVYYHWRFSKDDKKWKDNNPAVNERLEQMKRLMESEEALKPWMKEPRVKFDDYQKTLAQIAKWESEDKEHEHDTPGK